MMPLGRALSRPQEIPRGLGFEEASGNVCAELSVGFASIMAAVSAPGAVRGAQQRVSTKSQVNPLMMALRVGVGGGVCAGEGGSLTVAPAVKEIIQLFPEMSS